MWLLALVLTVTFSVSQATKEPDTVTVKRTSDNMVKLSGYFEFMSEMYD